MRSTTYLGRLTLFLFATMLIGQPSPSHARRLVFMGASLWNAGGGVKDVTAAMLTHALGGESEIVFVRGEADGIYYWLHRDEPLLWDSFTNTQRKKADNFEATGKAELLAALVDADYLFAMGSSSSATATRSLVEAYQWIADQAPSVQIVMFERWANPTLSMNDYNTEQDLFLATCTPLPDELGVPFAAAGEAWRTVFGETGEMGLLHRSLPDNDRHPNLYGTYLSACMNYCFVTGEKFEGEGFSPTVAITTEQPSSVPDNLARYFEDVSWRTHCRWVRGDSTDSVAVKPVQDVKLLCTATALVSTGNGHYSLVSHSNTDGTRGNSLVEWHSADGLIVYDITRDAQGYIVDARDYSHILEGTRVTQTAITDHATGQARGAVYYTYDTDGRLTSYREVNTQGIHEERFTYAYDAFGRRVADTVYSASDDISYIISYSRDSENRVMREERRSGTGVLQRTTHHRYSGTDTLPDTTRVYGPDDALISTTALQAYERHSWRTCRYAADRAHAVERKRVHVRAGSDTIATLCSEALALHGQNDSGPCFVPSPIAAVDTTQWILLRFPVFVHPGIGFTSAHVHLRAYRATRSGAVTAAGIAGCWSEASAGWAIARPAIVSQLARHAFVDSGETAVFDISAHVRSLPAGPGFVDIALMASDSIRSLWAASESELVLVSPKPEPVRFRPAGETAQQPALNGMRLSIPAGHALVEAFTLSGRQTRRLRIHRNGTDLRTHLPAATHPCLLRITADGGCIREARLRF